MNIIFKNTCPCYIFDIIKNLKLKNIKQFIREKIAINF